jgi:integrase
VRFHDRGLFESEPRILSKPLEGELRLHLMASPYKGEDDLIFPSSRGTPLDGNNMVRREFTPALRRARLPQVRFHDLRHSYASLLIAQGAHPKLISEQLGHPSVQITLDRYGHLMDQFYGDASDALEQAFSATSLQALCKHRPANRRLRLPSAR